MKNPYRPPDTEDTYVDPRIHAQVQLIYVLSDNEIKTVVKRYVVEHPFLILGFFAYVLAIAMTTALLEEFYGFTLPPWPSMILTLGGACASWLLASFLIRTRTTHNLQYSTVLGVGTKLVRVNPQTVEVESDGERAEFELKEVVLRGTVNQHYLVLEPARFEILIIPYHAFATQSEFKNFEKLMKKRLRNLRSFWSLRL